jgi:transcription initiation factor TFIID subunit TAF12
MGRRFAKFNVSPHVTTPAQPVRKAHKHTATNNQAAGDEAGATNGRSLQCWFCRDTVTRAS